MQTTAIRSRRRGFSLTAAVAVSSLMLAGCAGNSTSTNETNPPLIDTGEQIEEVTVAFPGSLANLYIGQESGILNYNLAATVQEGLVRQDATGAIVPALAESWETPDDTTYVFQLREDAKFHNGDPVTPQDVVFSIEQGADPELSPGVSFYLDNIASAEATGEHEVTVTTKSANANTLLNLSNSSALVVTQQEFWEEHEGKVGTSSSLLMGTGPYQVTEFQPDSHVVLERSENWWGDAPKAQRIRVNFIPDTSTRLAAAQNGEVDIAFNVPINQVDDWQHLDGMRVEAMNDLSYVGLTFDVRVAPFDDINVRKAIAMAVDRDAIVERLLHGYGEVATSIMTPESLGAAYDATAAREQLSEISQQEFDLDAAKELLAGTDAAGLELELAYPNTGPQLGLAAQAIAENLNSIGMNVTVREVPIEQWLAGIGDGETGLNFMWYFSTTGDPGEVNSYLVGPGNPSGFESAEAAEIIATANALTDPAERIAELLKLEQLNAEQLISAPLWWGQSITAFSNTVGITDYSAFTFTGPWGANLFAAATE